MRNFKKSKSLLRNGIRCILIATVLLMAAGCSSKLEKGTKVCAKWGTTWYMAEIVKNENGKYTVKYYDGTQGNVGESDLRVLLDKKEIKAGDQVLAVWQTGIFYPGTVKELKTDGALIKWEDGSETSLAKFGEITKK